MVRVILVDRFGSLAASARVAGWSEAEVLAWTDIVEVPLDPGTAFVSPANSLGYMDGGIDMVLSRVMFPGVEARVRAAIASRGRLSELGRPFLQIGEALAVPTQHPGVLLISAPTMWQPQDVRGTHNAYHAMYAALTEAGRQGAKVMVTPGLCTGCGMMEPETAVRQMMAAHRDVESGLPPRWGPEEVAREQPLVYVNSEFKAIAVTDMCRVASE